MQTLYRKYRPQDFREVYGQDTIVKVIKRQVQKGNLGHAYLFTGPRGTGKTSMARLLAKAANCTHIKDGNLCNTCNACISINKGKFLDLIEIDAASNRGIDEIRQLRERVNFSPSEGNYKVYIIDEVHMLTKDAFNALLKTLEEPPSHVIFILATTEPHKIPSTILSRCQRFNFMLAKDDIIIEKLKEICKKEKVTFSKKALTAIVKNSAGSFRDAESILEKVLGGIGVVQDKKVDLEDVEDILGLVTEREVEQFISFLLEKNAVESLKKFDVFVKEGVNLVQFIRQSLEYLRGLLIKKVAEKKGRYPLIDLLQIITELSDAESKVKESSVSQLPIEIAIVKICSESLSDARFRNRERISLHSKESSVQKKLPTKVAHVITHLPGKIKTSLKEKEDQQISEISIDEVKDKWDDIVEHMRPFNHHLSAFYKKARPVKLVEEKLFVEVPFSFHKQRIESQKARDIFGKVSKEIFGKCLVCCCDIVGRKSFTDSSTLQRHHSKSTDVVLEVLGDIIE